MKRLLLVLLLPFLLMTQLYAGPLSNDARRIVETGRSAEASWGIYAIDVQSGQVIADYNGSKLLIPASTRKLVSTAMAVSLFNPDERITTELWAGSLSADGRGTDVVLLAQGDPTWTPELQGGRPGSAVLRRIARQAREAGLQVIAGDLMIDVSSFDDPEPIPPGWPWHEFLSGYASRPAVLSVNKNLVGVSISPARQGQPLNIRFTQPTAPFELINNSSTLRPGAVPTIQFHQSLGDNTLMVTGGVAGDSETASRSLPIGNPTKAAAELLEAIMIEEGIIITGSIRYVTGSRRQGVLLATIEGATISSIVERTNLVSDNYLAESLYLLCARKRFGTASYLGAWEAEDRFWSRIGVPEREYRARDGSGLTRENLITPRAQVELLRAYRDVDWFFNSLPESGRSGTLRYRLSQNGMAGRVNAKTGTLADVSALSGYVRTRSGRTIAFCVMANHYTASAATMRQKIDQVVELLAAR